MPDDPINRLHNQPDLATALRDDHAALIARCDELLDSAKRAPARVTNEDEAGAVNDFIKMLDAARKRSEALRKDLKEPYLQAGREVDGFFKKISDPLLDTKRDLTSRVTRYLQEKESAERRRRQEEERRAREEAERLAREAEERAAALANDDDLDAAIAAEDAARIAEAEAAERRREAEAKAAELSRTRSDLGTVGSLRSQWVHDENSVDRAALDLEALRPHIPEAALHQAIRSFIRAGGRELRGARIYEVKTAVVR